MDAQALRKAFPEIGAQPTAEEMEGKELDEDNAQIVTGVTDALPIPTELPTYPDNLFKENLDKWQGIIESGKRGPDQIIAMVSSRYRLSDEQKAAIFDLASINVDPVTGEIIS